MAYDEKLAERIRAVLRRRRGVSEKNMFGGLSFLVAGNLCCGIVGDEIMVRVGPDAYEKSVAKPHAREMDFTGRPLRGMVYVAKPGFRTAKQLEAWIERGVGFARTLPSKWRP